MIFHIKFLMKPIFNLLFYLMATPIVKDAPKDLRREHRTGKKVVDLQEELRIPVHQPKIAHVFN